MPNDWLSVFFIANGQAPSKIAPKFWIKRRVQRSLHALNEDDKDLWRALGNEANSTNDVGGLLRDKMSKEDVYLATNKRGCVLPKSLQGMSREEVDFMYDTLTLWVENVRKDQNSRLPLVILNCLNSTMRHTMVQKGLRGLFADQ